MFNRTKAATVAPRSPKAPSWHELVKPGPKGDPAKKAARQAARRVGVPSTEPQHQPKPRTGRTYSAGMTVLHRTRMRPLPAGHPARLQPRPDVLRRQLIRGLRAQGIEVIDEAKPAA